MSEKFSMRRMLLFSRLQICEIYGSRPWKTLGLCFASTLALVLVSLLVEGWNLDESMGFAEDVLMLAAVVQSLALGSDLLALRLLVPVSALEKYLAVFFGSLCAAIVFLLVSGLFGSAIFSLISVAGSGADGGVRTLFVGNADCGYLMFAVYMPFFMWMKLFAIAKRRYGGRLVWSVLAALAAGILVPVILGSAGILDKKVATVIFMVMYAVAAVMSLVWGYRLLKIYESDSRDNE